MEVAGTAIGVLGLVGLYSTSIEMLDALSSAARYGVDRELLQTKIEVERVRLMVWGDSIGLTEIDLDPSKKEATEDDLAVIDEGLQRTTLRTAIAGLLTCFVHTFEDVEELQKRYGLVPQTESDAKETKTGTAEQPTREMLSATFRKTYSHFQNRTATAQKQASPLTKAVWAVSNERKFRALIAELKAINDSLTSLLPAVRDKTRVKMRAEIMQSNDVGQLQNLVSAVDDVTDLISETASLRLEMLSTRGGQGIPRKPVPRAVHVAPPASTPPLTPAAPLPRTLTPEPTSVIPQTPSPVPVVTPAIVEQLPRQNDPLMLPSGRPEPPLVPYDDAGSLVIHKVYQSPDSLSCYSWLSGIGEVPELSEVQSAFHPAFALRFVPDSILDVAGDLLEVDVESDPKYAGWSPGSASLTGFSRELNFWRKMGDSTERIQPTWARTFNTPTLSSELVLKRWKEIMQNGLGKNWTEKKGYEQVRELCGPSDYSWLDPEESFKIRHQISDLLAVMSVSPLESLEKGASIGFFANYEKINPNGTFGFVDFLLQLLEARAVTLRIARAKQRWYGGITMRIAYDMIAAELWGKSMEFVGQDRFESARKIKEQQVDGIIKFAEEMQWPYLDEIRGTAAKLLTQEAEEMQIDLRTWDWIGGLVLPGGFFSLAVIGTLYNLSPTLRNRLPSTTVKMRKGNYGIVYPQASYWSIRSVLGKVLAPMSLSNVNSGNKIKCLGGWVGPCPSPSLPESTFGLAVELKGRSPTFITEDKDHDDDATRTFMPTMQSKKGNAAEWAEPTPPLSSTDSVELQTLRLSKTVATEEDYGDSREVTGDKAPPMYQARLDFQLTRSKTMVTVTLYANSIFVAAPPCRGTHRVDPRTAVNYSFRVLRIEDLPQAELDGTTAVTVIDATSGGVAETFGRAWCCEKGTNAVVWKREGGKCCFKCALMVAGKEGVGAGALIMC